MHYPPLAAMLMMASLALALPIREPNQGAGSHSHNPNPKSEWTRAPELITTGAAHSIKEDCLRQAPAVAEMWRKSGAPDVVVQQAVKQHTDECHQAYARAVRAATDRVLARERAQLAQEKGRREGENAEPGTGTELQQFAVLQRVPGVVAGRLHAVENAGRHLLRYTRLGPAVEAAVMRLAHPHHAPRVEMTMPTALEVERAAV
ncbi:MAG: hypothetical protein M1826_003361 [Phylliscum demangeonii]|nr:MAG: hypothetical protein M1826_003361 [Phylliscum demangeonii]